MLAAQRAMRPKQIAGPKMTLEDLRAAKNEAYQKADNIGASYSADQVDNLVTGISDDMSHNNIDAVLQPKASRTLEKIQERGGQPASLRDIENIRKMAQRNPSAAIEGEERRLGGMMTANVDEFLNSTVPSNTQGPEAVRALQEARGLAQRSFKAKEIQDAFYKAENDAASAGSGVNAENATRKQIKSILNTPKKRRGFSEDEVSSMESFVRGTPMQNGLRMVGKLSPQGNGLMAALGGGAVTGGLMSGNPALAALPAAGFVAKRAADKGSQKAAQSLLDLVISGGKFQASKKGLKASEQSALQLLMMQHLADPQVVGTQ
jgi:hypothetical protein